MPTPPPVEYVITRPAAPSWWKEHRHLVLLTVGLIAGWQLFGAPSGDAADHDQPARHPPVHVTVPSPPPTSSPGTR